MREYTQQYQITKFFNWSFPPQRVRQNSPMRLDHISYVTSQTQLADTIQRIGSRLRTTFVDGGIHPRFGTRNFTAPLKNGRYLEVVCPLDHPVTEQTPWGKAVLNKANYGGGWFTWVFSTENIRSVEFKFGRESIEGNRKRPNGSELKWKQIGVKEIIDYPEFPFFIQWLTNDHPSKDGKAEASVTKIVIADENRLTKSFFKSEIYDSMEDVEIEWIDPKKNEGNHGIVSVSFTSPFGVTVID